MSQLPLPAIPWRDECVSRIMLGTAQLGMNYGIANVRGQPDAPAAAAIVEAAWACGIRHFDTAQSYGESEAVLGRALQELGIAAEAHINSKLSVELDPRDTAEIKNAIDHSFERLGTSRLWCMMLHRPAWLDHWDEGLGDLLRAYRSAGSIAHLGASLLGPEDAPRCLAHPDIEVLQVACNAWDRRILRRGVLESAQNHRKLCCIRSIYLQGLLGLSPERVATRLPRALEPSRRWAALTQRYGMGPVEMAVRFATTLEAPLVIGAESPEQLSESVRLAHKGPLLREILDALAESIDPVVDETILDPRHWTRP